MHVRLFEAALGAAAALAVPVGAIGLSLAQPGSSLQAAATVEVGAAAVDFPLPGEFLSDGRPVAVPVMSIHVPAFHIMKHQVTAADYSRCVADGACQAVDVTAQGREEGRNVPVTGVSYLDASAYAAWYTRETGESWRLPTAEEAAAAAAERFSGEGFSPVFDDPANPAVAWIRRYREEAAAKRPADPVPKPLGHYGANTNGVYDIGGNVWEWTSTCYVRTTLGADRRTVEHSTDNCGVHVLQGRHRAYMPNFEREGKSGGCAVGTPPENLGFRLIRESSPLAGPASLARRLAVLARL